MRARPNPFERQLKKGGLYSYDGPRKEPEPTESQIKAAMAIAERFGINLPDVFTKLMISGGMQDACWYQCEVCGRRTEPQTMPWIAEKVWNKGEYLDEMLQYSLF